MVFRIKSTRKYLTKAATEILVLSLVVSHLDYCNLILYGIAEIELTKIQRIHNMCAKLVLSRGKYDSAKQALFDLYWLPIKAIINFKILTSMYNCGTGRARTYLIELLSERVNQRQGLSSASDPGIRYDIPFNKKNKV